MQDVSRWRDSLTNATVLLMQRAAERQAFDNLAMVAASCLLETVVRTIRHDRVMILVPFRNRRRHLSTAKRRTHMHSTPVKDLMEDRLIMISPDASLSEAAKKMKEMNCGSLLVGDRSRPEGIITDRDMIVRAVARDADPAEERVRDHMTGFILSCKTSDTLADAAQSMREHGVSRLVVTDEDGRACGLLSFGRILRNHDDTDELSGIITNATGRKTAALSDAAKRAH